jgi:hypothetical protein
MPVELHQVISNKSLPRSPYTRLTRRRQSNGTGRSGAKTLATLNMVASFSPTAVSRLRTPSPTKAWAMAWPMPFPASATGLPRPRGQMECSNCDHCNVLRSSLSNTVIDFFRYGRAGIALRSIRTTVRATTPHAVHARARRCFAVVESPKRNPAQPLLQRGDNDESKVQSAVQPPSTRSDVPVTRADASEARNTSAPIKSSIIPMRPSLIRERTASSACSLRP